MKKDTFVRKVNLAKHDNSIIKRSVLPCTESEYDEALQTFDKFIEEHPGSVSPPDVQTFKAFMEYVGINIVGRLEERPTVDTVDGWRRKFQTGLARRRNFFTPKHVETTIREYIRTELKHMIGLSEAQREKAGLSPNDLAILMAQLWCRDFREYRGEYPDRARVQLSASLLLYCFTSARAGEVHESTRRRKRARLRMEKDPDEQLRAKVMAACYRHFELTLEWVEGELMLVLQYQRRYIKRGEDRTKWDLPLHLFYEIYTEKLPLFLNLLVFFLPMASADGAFRDYSRVTDILDEAEELTKAGPTEAKIVRTIYFKNSVLDTPVFRQWLECDVKKTTGKARGADSFSKQIVDLGHRSGFRININAGASRRWALQEADHGHSETARMKFAGHFDPKTYRKAYAHPISDVDGLATYLNIPARMEHIKNHRSMATNYSPHMWQSLPAKQTFEFEARGDIQKISSDIQNVRLQMKQENDDNKKQTLHRKMRQLETQKYRAYREELARVREDNTQERGSPYEETLFQYHRRVMPERDLLAQILPTSVEIRSLNGREALIALEALCVKERKVLYRSNLAPNGENCVCGEHIIKNRYSRMGADAFAEFCFECDVWYSERHKWTQHCHDHLHEPENLIRCDIIIFHNAPVKAGLCPFCLGDEVLGPVRRMQQFLDRAEWYKHIESHLSAKARSGELNCSHPACRIKFDEIDKLRFHLEDIHCCKPPRGMKRHFEN
ncbi:hypothetical protein BJX63DRAFT_424461 [Aspergillus granulosus]|uniref:C2H2-type domain-containing protein n=1 Tax=Aspergillus granulosus TaxID=176169 RepID=A0ABR4GZP5_9EURO